MMYNKRLHLILLLFLICTVFIYAENIDPNNNGSQYSYGENIGWINFEPNIAEPNVGAHVNFEKLTGYVWSENIGWINLSPQYGGVLNNGLGQLNGYAWGENVGWINFNPKVQGDSNDYGVIIDKDGNFKGWAWSENTGWINFGYGSIFQYRVKADDFLLCTGYELVEERRISRTVFEDNMKMRMKNLYKQQIENTTAQLSTVPPAVTVMNDKVYFPSIPSGQEALSSDSFIIRIDRSIPVNEEDVFWSLSEQLEGDFTDDGQWSLADWALFAEMWLEVGDGMPQDLYMDGRIDFRDFAILAEKE